MYIISYKNRNKKKIALTDEQQRDFGQIVDSLKGNSQEMRHFDFTEALINQMFLINS